MLEIKNLTKRYDNVVIDNLNIVLPSTGMVAIIGDSGCGKTTLLNLIGGIDLDYEGEILLDYQNIKSIKHYCRKHVGFIFQNFNLINWLNIKENYLLPSFFTKILYKRAIDVQEEKLELRKINKKKIRVLSGGQKQRVALLRAMIKNVDILLCDEPTGSLDGENAKIVFDILSLEAKERLVIVITHDEQLAYKYADNCFVLKNGKLFGDKNKMSNQPFYPRLVKRYRPLKLCQLAILQFRSNLNRNFKISFGITMSLICIMITFALSGSLKTQIMKQLKDIFPNQLISIQNNAKKDISYNDILNLSKVNSNVYLYGEPVKYEFMGVSLSKEYKMDNTVYISDMTKPTKINNLELGRTVYKNNEVVLSKTTAVHLNHDYQDLLNKQIYGYYLKDNEIKGIPLKVVGIEEKVTAFDTIYINQLANIEHINNIFGDDKEKVTFQVAMMNLNNSCNVKKELKKLKQQFPQLKFKVIGKDISKKINSIMLQIERILMLFSSLAIVSACFLIGEVLYLSIVEKTKDIGIFKCLGASNLQIMNLTLLESFTLISSSYVCSYLLFNQILGLINHFVENELQLNLSESFISVDYKMMFIIYIGAIVLGLLSSYLPAYLASRLDPVRSLKYQSY